MILDRRELLAREKRDNARLRRCGTRFPGGCRCGDYRLQALVPAREICYECRLIESGRSPIEDHHIAGRRNDAFTIPLSGNDHRCVTDLQEGWPKKTRRNPHNSPLLKNAAWARGLRDLFLIWADYLSGLARLLEDFDEALERKFGSGLWERIFPGGLDENEEGHE